MIASITVRGRTPADQKERDLDLFRDPAAEDAEEWIGIAIRQPSETKDKSFATVWVLKKDLMKALEAMSESERQQSERADWLIEQVRRRRLSYGKAAELAGIPKSRFVQMMADRHVSPLDYNEDEFQAEVRAAEQVVRR